MGYIYLVLSFLSSLVIAIALRFFEGWHYDRVIVIASNYAVAGSLGVILSKPSPLPQGVIPFAVFVGFLFFTTFIVYSLSIKKDGIAPAVTFGRISMAIPVIVSIIFWGERPKVFNWAGLVIVLLVILTWEGKITGLSMSLLGLFLLSGTISTSMKFFKVKFPSVDEGYFLIFLFFSALVWSWSYVILTRRKPGLAPVIGGLIVGIPNFFSSYFLLKGLKTVPAYVSFPFISVNLIIFSAVAGYIIFHEKLCLRKTFLLFLGAAGVILLAI